MKRRTRAQPQTVLVTGAAGKTGRAVLRACLAGGLGVRAFVRNAGQLETVRGLGVDDVAIGDLRDDAALREAAQGARAIYHICPNMHADEVEIGTRVIGAARQAAVERFVLHSVLHPQTEKMPHHWAKLRVEEALLESGLAATILQPAPYMQNVLGQWQAIVERGLYSVPYAVSARTNLVDLEDVAAVAAKVLRETDHAGATYELCGPENLDPTEIAARLSRHLGRAVRAEAVPRDAWAREAMPESEGSFRLETLIKMFRYYERYGLTGTPGVLEWLLGRPATGFAGLLERQTR